MRKGLLAQWRRGIVARGLAAAALLAIPVAVAAAIGFGNSLSGIAGGLSAVANGPDQVAAPTGTTAAPRRLDRAVVALADPTPARGGTGGGGGGVVPEGAGGTVGTGTTGGTGGGTGAGQGGSPTGGGGSISNPTGPVSGGGQPGAEKVIGGLLNEINEGLSQLLGGGS
jgi:hypothetical protein